MYDIPLPSQFEIQSQTKNKAIIIISPCYPGYGTTLGNALRRVLLSSLEGAAIKAVRFSGAYHEFSSIDHVKEDVVGIILNLKTIRLKLLGDDDVQLMLKAHGEKKVTVADIEPNSQIEFLDTDQYIAEITDDAGSLEIELTVGRGRGYDPVEFREKDKLPLGTIAIDAIYTPIRRVNFRTENVRVGQMTNYEKCYLDIETDGTVVPFEAFHKASKILVDHFKWFSEQKETQEDVSDYEEIQNPEKSEESIEASSNE